MTFMDNAEFVVFLLAWAVLTALQVGDVATTNQFLKQHKSTEGNRVMRWWQNWIGARQGVLPYKSVWWLVKLFVVPLLLLGVYVHSHAAENLFQARAILAFMIFVMGGLISWYIKVVRGNDDVNKNKPANSV